MMKKNTGKGNKMEKKKENFSYGKFALQGFVTGITREIIQALKDYYNS